MLQLFDLMNVYDARVNFTLFLSEIAPFNSKTVFETANRAVTEMVTLIRIGLTLTSSRNTNSITDFF